MNLDLAGKRAIVCGSTRGIGRACAEELARLGATCVLVARRADALRAVAAELDDSAGQTHSWREADFSDPETVRRAAASALEDGGGAHILINNTGGPPGGRAIDAAPEEYLSAFTAHLICNQVLAQTLTPAMRAAGYGRIINIISTSVKEPIPNLGVSNTVRGAVASWAKTLSKELGPDGITVNNVLPGFTSTDRLASLISKRAESGDASEQEVAEAMKRGVPLGRFAKPEETAAAVAFLASPAAAYITGINLPVEGGRVGSL